MKKNAAVMTVIAVIALAGFGVWYFANSPDIYTGKMETINIGTVPTAASALIYIAKDQHFFAANGLNVNIKDYNTGAATTEGLLEGEIDIAWVAEFPFVKRAFAKEEIRIITVVGRFSEQHLFGRPRNTIAEFYMGRFLELHGMTAQDVTIIDVPAQESVDAIESGRVDGVIVWEPYSSKIGVQLAAVTLRKPRPLCESS